MKFWTPPPVWRDEPVYIIGGGPSLAGFDFELLRPKHSIGCNGAYLLGPQICDVLVFGDWVFWEEHAEDIEREYVQKAAGVGFDAHEGLVATNLPNFRLLDHPHWLHVTRRQGKGLHTGDTLGWNCNTGALALNLGLVLGADPIYLLGFDMRLVQGQSNWHNQGCFSPDPAVYQRFIDAFRRVKDDLEEKFTGRRVINLSDDSALQVFPVEPLTGHFGAAEVDATDEARALARDQGIDLCSIRGGSGTGGRILVRDVRDAEQADQEA